MSVLSLPLPDVPAAVSAFARGSRPLVIPGRPVDRVTLAHHLAVVPLPARTFALLTGNAPGELPADAALVRWVAARLRSVSARIVAGEASSRAFRQDLDGLLALGADLAPAGEELLVGLAAAAFRLGAWRLVPEAGVAAFASSLAGLALPGLPEPTRRAVADAARGGFSAPLAGFVDILGVAEAEDGALKEAAQRLAAGGTRPGSDALAGVVALVRDVALGLA